MPEDRPVASRLAERAARRGGMGPLRGLGAGLPANQKMAGVANPEAAAALAAMDPAVAAEQMERAEARHAELEDMLEELKIAKEQGEYTPPGDLEKADEAELSKWHAEMLKKREAAVDEDMGIDSRAAAEEAVRDAFRFGPDHHLYEPINDLDRRKQIESSLKPIEIEELLFLGYVNQEIPISQNLRYTLRSLTTQQTLWLEEYVADLPRSSQQHIAHQMGLLQLAVGLVEVNGKPFYGSDLYSVEEKDHFFKSLKQNLDKVSKLPAAVTDDLIVQYAWFSGRVRKSVIGGNLAKKVGN